MFFLLVISILFMGYAYIGWRIFVPMPDHLQLKKVLWVLLIGLMTLPFIQMILRWRRIDFPLWEEMSWATYISLGFFSFVFTFLLFRDVPIGFIALVKGLVSVFKDLRKRRSIPDMPSLPERRGFLIHSTNLGILGLSGALSGFGLSNALRPPGIVYISVPIPDLPPALESLRIVQITDIHVSPTIRRDYVQAVADRVNRLDPHLIVFTGDFADGTVSQFGRAAAPLKDLSARYGSYFVTGNHEYYAGVREWVAEAERLNMNVLLNEHDIVVHEKEPFILAGVTDFNGGRFFRDHVSDPKKAVQGAPEDRFKILLAHQPRSIFSAAQAGFDLQISGHTHGGQFYPWQLFVGLQQPYLAGLHMYDKTAVYVSRGTGYWGPPMRLGAPSEITLITLKRQDL